MVFREDDKCRIASWIGSDARTGLGSETIPLFCFPYAGGGASVFRSWNKLLPLGISVCPIQLPGRESRWNEPSFTHLPSLVEGIARDLSPMFHRPFALFGHSMGALVAFELGRYLESRNIAPVHLFVSGSRPPQLPDHMPPLRYLSDAELLAALRCLNGMPDEVCNCADLIQLLLPAIRADIILCESYVHYPGTPLRCPISVYAGHSDPRVRLTDLARWAVHTRGTTRSRIFPGEHFYLFTSQAMLVRSIATDIAQSCVGFPLIPRKVEGAGQATRAFGPSPRGESNGV